MAPHHRSLRRRVSSPALATDHLSPGTAIARSERIALHSLAPELLWRNGQQQALQSAWGTGRGMPRCAFWDPYSPCNRHRWRVRSTVGRPRFDRPVWMSPCRSRSREALTRNRTEIEQRHQTDRVGLHETSLRRAVGPEYFCQPGSCLQPRRRHGGGFGPGVILFLLGLSASPERVRPSAAEFDERQLAPYMPMSNRRGPDSMHTLLIPPVSSEFGHPRTPQSPKPRSSDVAHLTANSGDNEPPPVAAGISGRSRTHARENRQGQAEGRLQALTRQSFVQNICTETR